MNYQPCEAMIGIIGGMGPYAGLDLAKKIFDNTLAATDQEHLSVALLSESCAIIDRTEYLLGNTNTNPGHSIATVALQLERIGAQVAAISCNTAHAPSIFQLVTDKLQRSQSRLKILHLIEETILFLRTEFPHHRRIGVLSTTGTYQMKLYAQPLMKAGYTVIQPNPQVQGKIVNEAIYHAEFGIKARSNPVTDQAKEWFETAIAILIEDGADLIILGCTELTLAVSEHYSRHVPLIDPITIMARALIKTVAPHKLKPGFAMAS